MVETAPNKDQLKTILDYAGGKGFNRFVTGATSEQDAMKKLAESEDNFRRPVVGAAFAHATCAELILGEQLVDWNNGKAGRSHCETS